MVQKDMEIMCNGHAGQYGVMKCFITCSPSEDGSFMMKAVCAVCFQDLFVFPANIATIAHTCKESSEAELCPTCHGKYFHEELK